MTPAELETLLARSNYARRLITAEPTLLHEIADLSTRALDRGGLSRLLSESTPPNDEPELAQRLRATRKRALLSIMARDLCGRADLEEVMGSMTLLAETVLAFALPLLYQWQSANGVPQNPDGSGDMPLVVIAMGKFGSGELNVSSDIDLIFAYPEDGEIETVGGLSHFEFFTRLARKLTGILNETTADGFVFRVDTRLRPYGESGPLVASFAMLENYYTCQGREWERYAWIKGRVVCGTAFEAELKSFMRPFVFRKYLDFGALASLRTLHAQIRAEVARRDLFDDIKRGPGGIREIEFIAQVFQLIRGGRDPALQIMPTLQVLTLLAQRNLLPEAAASELADAYRFLRRLEHRLQYFDDQQTHRVPGGAEARQSIAMMMGYVDYDTLAAALAAYRARVSMHFDSIFVAMQRGKENPLALAWQAGNNDALAEQLQAFGFSDPAALQRLAAVRASSRYAHLPESSRQRFDALLPQLVEVAAQFPNREQTLARGLDLLETISRRESYLALLHEYPGTLDQVLKLCSASGWAAQYLTRQPILLDELIRTRTIDEQVDWRSEKLTLASTLQALDGDTEQQLDALRLYKNAMVFKLLAQDLAGALTIERLSDELSALADMLLDLVLETCWRQLKTRHREDPRIAIIAYGKLGGKELGYASDLDMIFLYDDDDQEAAYQYAKLAQRMNLWLTQTTPAGVLYETDLRLRPDGASGLLVSSIEAFEAYQKNKAWVWEHQALTRARWCAGCSDIEPQFTQVRTEILRIERDPTELRKNILEMREKIHAAHPNTSELFDIKHDRGGIVDIEFAVQYVVLLHAYQHAELLENRGNIYLLQLSERLGLLKQDIGTAAADAYREFRRLQHAQRLSGDRYARVPRAAVQTQIKAVKSLWQACFNQ